MRDPSSSIKEIGKRDLKDKIIVRTTRNLKDVKKIWRKVPTVHFMSCNPIQTKSLVVVYYKIIIFM